MNELEQVWTQKLSDARARAVAAGRSEIAEYLALRQTNDFLRQTSLEWLFDAALAVAAEANRAGARVTVETDDRHRFAHGNATLAGSVARLASGVRRLTIEAGWTRQPGDGFMRGGALAAAHLTHFGQSKHDAELVLMRTDGAPSWFAVNKNGARELFHAAHLRRHFEIFMGSV